MNCKVLLIACLFPLALHAQQRHEDTEKLGMALEYFTYGKYHEALLLFQQLDKRYELNARFRAYIGLCYYYEWEYDKATKYLDEMLPKLEPLAPAERSVYYYADAESHFQLQQYAEAVPLYEAVLLLGFDRDKGDAFYRLGFCYYFLEQWGNAHDAFLSADAYYRQYRNVADVEARLAQISKMINGLSAYLRQQSSAEADPSLNQ